MAISCCGGSEDDRIKLNVKLTAVINMIGKVSISTFVAFFLILIAIRGYGSITEGLLLGSGFILLLCYFLSNLLVSYKLWKGAQEEDVAKCRLWNRVNKLEICMDLVVLGLCFAQLVSGNTLFDKDQVYEGTFQVSTLGFVLFFILVWNEGLGIWTVSRFISRITSTQNITTPTSTLPIQLDNIN